MPPNRADFKLVKNISNHIRKRRKSFLIEKIWSFNMNFVLTSTTFISPLCRKMVSHLFIFALRHCAWRILMKDKFSWWSIHFVRMREFQMYLNLKKSTWERWWQRHLVLWLHYFITTHKQYDSVKSDQMHNQTVKYKYFYMREINTRIKQPMKIQFAVTQKLLFIKKKDCF